MIVAPGQAAGVEALPLRDHHILRVARGSTPASHTPNRCSALPASSAEPDTAAAVRLRPDTIAPNAPPTVKILLPPLPQSVRLTRHVRVGHQPDPLFHQPRCDDLQHSVDDPEPKYGLAVTGIADPNRLLRNDAGQPGTPLSLTKPLGIGVLNSRHKATGERFPEAIEVMTTLNAEAASAALEAGVECATDVTGFGLLGHLHNWRGPAALRQ